MRASPTEPAALPAAPSVVDSGSIEAMCASAELVARAAEAADAASAIRASARGDAVAVPRACGDCAAETASEACVAVESRGGKDCTNKLMLTVGATAGAMRGGLVACSFPFAVVASAPLGEEGEREREGGDVASGGDPSRCNDVLGNRESSSCCEATEDAADSKPLPARADICGSSAVDEDCVMPPDMPNNAGE